MDDPQNPQQEDTPKEPLTYEETPVIEPQATGEAHEESAPPVEDNVPTIGLSQSEMPSSSMPSDVPPPPAPAPEMPPAPTPPRSKGFVSRLMGTIGTLLLFIILFGVGVWLSGIVRNYLSAPSETQAPTPTEAPQEVTVPAGGATTSATVPSTWKRYGVISGLTRKEIAGISYELPPEAPAPICDGASCASQGTYLPGGTRFTVAPRGTGQVLKDFRGSIISDLRGQAFIVTEVTVAGRPAIAYKADFTGSTAGGYTFGQMRGVMIEVTDTLSLELNHFTPTGVTADFAADDKLFDQILTKVNLSGAEKGSASPSGATLQ